jgi:hypothetical protein
LLLAEAIARAPAGTPDYVPLQHMADYSFDKDNRFTVTMENGTVWRQIKEDSTSARWRSAPQSYRVATLRQRVPLLHARPCNC